MTKRIIRFVKSRKRIYSSFVKHISGSLLHLKDEMYLTVQVIIGKNSPISMSLLKNYIIIIRYMFV